MSTPRGVLTGSDSHTILTRQASLSKTSLHSFSAQNQVEQLTSQFVAQASDWKSLAAIMAGGLAYRFGKIAAMNLGGGASATTFWRTPLRVGSVAFGLGSEVTAFEFTIRTLLTLSPHPDPLPGGEGGAPSPVTGHLSPNLWSWSGPGGWKEGLVSSAINFSLLKGAGHLAQQENLIIRQLFPSTAMVLGHHVGAGLNITPAPEGTWPEQFSRAFITNIQLMAGASLTHSLSGGKLLVLEKGLDLVALARTASPIPLISSRRKLRNIPQILTLGVGLSTLFSSDIVHAAIRGGYEHSDSSGLKELTTLGSLFLLGATLGGKGLGRGIFERIGLRIARFVESMKDQDPSTALPGMGPFRSQDLSTEQQQHIQNLRQWRQTLNNPKEHLVRRILALKKLTQAGDPDALSLFKKIAKNKKEHPFLRANAVWALGESRNTSAIPLLNELLRDPQTPDYVSPAVEIALHKLAGFIDRSSLLLLFSLGTGMATFLSSETAHAALQRGLSTDLSQGAPPVALLGSLTLLGMAFWKKKKGHGNSGKINVETVFSEAERRKKVEEALREAQAQEKGTLLWDKTNSSPTRTQDISLDKLKGLFREIMNGNIKAFEELNAEVSQNPQALEALFKLSQDPGVAAVIKTAALESLAAHYSYGSEKALEYLLEAAKGDEEAVRILADMVSFHGDEKALRSLTGLAKTNETALEGVFDIADSGDKRGYESLVEIAHARWEADPQDKSIINIIFNLHVRSTRRNEDALNALYEIGHFHPLGGKYLYHYIEMFGLLPSSLGGVPSDWTDPAALKTLYEAALAHLKSFEHRLKAAKKKPGAK